MSQVVTVDRTDTLAASTTHLRPGYQVSVRDLLHLLLISSDNAAARALARTSPWGPAGFVARMNEKATELGLQSTNYADPSGLDPANVSSAYDMARLITYASGDERISEIMRKPEYTLTLGAAAGDDPQHQPPAVADRHGRQRARREDRVHRPVGLLPGHAAEDAAGQPAGGGGGARRAVERRPLHRGAQPVQLDVRPKAQELLGKKDEDQDLNWRSRATQMRLSRRSR